jgi:hypothetical protein
VGGTEKLLGISSAKKNQIRLREFFSDFFSKFPIFSGAVQVDAKLIKIDKFSQISPDLTSKFTKNLDFPQLPGKRL